MSWTVERGDATLSASSTSTDGSGRTEVSVTLGESAGPIRIEARAAGAGAVTFTATAEPGPALRLRLPEGFQVVGLGSGTRPDLEVLDEYGNRRTTDPVVLTSRSPSILEVEGTRVRGLARGSGVIVASVGALSDSIRLACLGPDELAVAALSSDGRTTHRAPPSEPVSLTLRALGMSGSADALVGVQGALHLAPAASSVAASEAPSGFQWVSVAEGGGELSFLAWTADSDGGQAPLGVLTISPSSEENVTVTPVVEVAGGPDGVEITDRVMVVPSTVAWSGGAP